MAFEIKTVQPKLFAQIFTADVIAELNRFIFVPESSKHELAHRRWAIDKQALACVIWVHMIDRMNADHCYAFIWNRQVVLIKEVVDCKYAVVHASASLGDRMAEAKSMIQEALQKGGRYLRGALETDESNSIPMLQFVRR